MKKIFFIFLFLCSILSCAAIGKKHEQLIDEIIRKPENMVMICDRSQFKLSELLKNNLKFGKNKYFLFFNKYNKEYQVMKVLKGKFNNNEKMSIFVVDKLTKSYIAEFQFEKENGKWIVFHNIVLPDDLGS